MTVLVKNKLALQVPQAIQKKAGIRPGDLIEFTAAKGTITIRAATPSKEGRVPLYTPTKAEAAAIRRGRTAFRGGEYITLKQLHEELDATRRQARKKGTRKAS
jgi:bifunctional DNA-binding transcriptional regulator/antitoxin component of YhaV-PrlF toxin-antitoxin module